MQSDQGFHLLDYIEFIIRRKQLILLVFFSALVTTYVLIYVFMEEQYEATAVIIPRQDESASLASSVLRGIRNVPLNLGTMTPSAQIDLYKTIIYSRTMMEDVVRRFNLFAVYRLDTTDVAVMEKAIKRLEGDVVTKETEQGAFVITVRSNNRQRSADMTNYIVQALNERIIDLQVSRSRDNRIFLENRVKELRTEISIAEDSMQVFQERTGLLDVKSQLQGILTTHATLETDFASKQLQLEIARKLYSDNSPQVSELAIQVREYEKKLDELRTEGDPGSPLLALKTLPAVSVEYLRLFKEIEIDNLVLEYVMPMYEQAKFEEKKDYPILQIIDHAIPPARKSFPPRVLFSLIGACFVTLSVLASLFLKERVRNVRNERWRAILAMLTQWDWKHWKPTT